MQRESFLFYRSFYNAIRLLGDKSRLKLYDSVMKLNFESDENVSNLEQLCTEIETKLEQNRTIYAQFLLIKPQIIANLMKYKNGCKGAEYGALGAEFGKFGGRPKKPPKNPPNDKGIRNKEEGIRKKEEGIRNKDISFKKEKSFQNFQNSDFEEIETNEINETKQPLKFADLPENLRVCGKNEGVFKPPKLEEVKEYCLNERQNTIDYEQFYDFYTSKGWYIGKNKMKDWRAAVRTWEKGSNKTQKQKTADPPCIRPEFEDYYRFYEELCPNLPRLRFERRNTQIQELLARFIDEIDNDVGYFKSLCEKANKLKKICESQIDFKMLINNHIGIFNGRYENDIFDITEYFKNNGA
ncbi:MAG: DUF6291 domain-containing protein [Candidatus Gastranaerophilales bacterium]|nr:DUF6291 domain-containing protein [Candidatus Gastranaerophilales bacterium]